MRGRDSTTHIRAEISSEEVDSFITVEISNRNAHPCALVQLHDHAGLIRKISGSIVDVDADISARKTLKCTLIVEREDVESPVLVVVEDRHRPRRSLEVSNATFGTLVRKNIATLVDEERVRRGGTNNAALRKVVQDDRVSDVEVEKTVAVDIAKCARRTAVHRSGGDNVCLRGLVDKRTVALVLEEAVILTEQVQYNYVFVSVVVRVTIARAGTLVSDQIEASGSAHFLELENARLVDKVLEQHVRASLVVRHVDMVGLGSTGTGICAHQFTNANSRQARRHNRVCHEFGRRQTREGNGEGRVVLTGVDERRHSGHMRRHARMDVGREDGIRLRDIVKDHTRRPGLLGETSEDGHLQQQNESIRSRRTCSHRERETSV